MGITDLSNVWAKRQQFAGTDHPGLRLNNLTSTQRDALTGAGAAKAGDIIWNSTTSAVEFYNGSSWLILPNNLDATEFGALDGVTAGTVTASKALVVDANKDIATIRHLTISGNLVTGSTTLSETELGYVDAVTAGQFPAASKAVVAGSDGYVPHRIHVIDDGAAVVLTSADSGGLVVMDKTDGSLTTLPELTASTIGMTFEFQWPASYASGTQKIITGNAADFIVGTILKMDTDTLTDPLSVESYNGSSHIAVVVDAVTDGGLLGSWLRFTGISATQWLIQGILHHSGSVSASASTT